MSLTVAGIANSKIKTDIETNLPTLETEKPEGFGMFRILHQEHGDKRLIWDPTDFVQINEAKKLYRDLIAEGFVPYYIDPKTGETTSMPMDEFDSQVGEVFLEEREIIMVPMQHAVGG